MSKFCDKYLKIRFLLRGWPCKLQKRPIFLTQCNEEFLLKPYSKATKVPQNVWILGTPPPNIEKCLNRNRKEKKVISWYFDQLHPPPLLRQFSNSSRKCLTKFNLGKNWNIPRKKVPQTI